MVSFNNETEKEMWQTDAKPVLAKLETIKTFAVVENKDGCALAKQINKRLSKHAISFKALNLNSLLKCRD
eukprot:2679352-Pleurochrysis_carterae.AAC.1